MEITQSKLKQTSMTEEDYLLENSRSTCFRCGGFVVATFCISPEQGTSDWEIPAWRCLQCGDVIDSTILRNRFRSQLQPSNQN